MNAGDDVARYEAQLGALASGHHRGNDHARHIGGDLELAARRIVERGRFQPEIGSLHARRFLRRLGGELR